MVRFCHGGWQEIFTSFEPGHLKSKKNKQGAAETVVNYEYDDLYQLEKKDFPSGTDTEFETDAHGRRTNMKDASGEKRYSYDDADRLIEVVQGPIGFTEGTNENYKLEYTWNAASQRTEMTLTIRGLSPETWTYSYTDDGQLLKIMSQGASIEPEFLDDGRLSLISLPNGAAREFFYQDTTDLHAYVSGKNRHLRKTLDKKSGGATICSFAYELDPAGNRLSVTDKDGKYKAFGYDPNYQLTAETKWSAKAPGTREGQEMYLYDPNGNRLLQFSDGVKKAYEYGPNNEMTEAGDERFVYDEFGNLIAEGNGPEEFEFFYDFESHMIEAKNTTQSTKDEFGYDGDGRRMWAFWDSGSDPVHFVYDELETAYPAILAEYTLVSGTFTIKSLNTHAPGIGLIYTDREGTFRYFHFDALGSTAALTDETETVTDTYAYTAFGVPTSTTGSSVNPFRYVGQYGYYEDGSRGAAASLLLLGVRCYSPEVGRFLQWDQVPHTNLYMYCSNEPVAKFDPWGLFVPVYGKYCGPQMSEGKGRPVDQIDTCCFEHDKCWAQKKPPCGVIDQDRREECRKCNMELCTCLWNAKCRGLVCDVARLIFLKYACPTRVYDVEGYLPPEHRYPGTPVPRPFGSPPRVY